MPAAAVKWSSGYSSGQMQLRPQLLDSKASKQGKVENEYERAAETHLQKEAAVLSARLARAVRCRQLPRVARAHGFALLGEGFRGGHLVQRGTCHYKLPPGVRAHAEYLHFGRPDAAVNAPGGRFRSG